MSNVVHLPAAVNHHDPLSASLDRIREVHAHAVESVRGASGVDFTAVERSVHAVLYELERVVLADVLAAAEPTSPIVEVNGVRYRRMNSVSRGEYHSLHTRIPVDRHLYRQIGVHNGPTIDPIAVRCGLIEGRYTPLAGVAVAHLAQAVPSREGGELCESMGVLPYSRSGMNDLANAIGARWEATHGQFEEALMKDFDIPDEATSVSLAADRISLPMAEDREPTARDRKRGIKRPISVQGRMAWVACWTLHDAKGDPLWSTRYAHIPEGGRDELTAALEGDLWCLMRQRPDLDVVTLADGAADVQGLLEAATEPFEVTARLTDFYHLTEHLGEAATSVGLDAEPILERFVEALLTDDHAIETIEQELQTWAAPCGEVLPDGLYNALTYIENQRERLRYASVRAAGLPIGSGHVEATGKTIVTVRFKRAGARWRPTTAQGLLGLRALATSSRWRQAMALLTATYAIDVVEHGAERRAS